MISARWIDCAKLYWQEGSQRIDVDINGWPFCPSWHTYSVVCPCCCISRPFSVP